MRQPPKPMVSFLRIIMAKGNFPHMLVDNHKDVGVASVGLMSMMQDGWLSFALQ